MLPTKIVLARNLTRLRKKHDITQGALAEKIGTSNKCVSKWENGETTPDLDALVALASFYNVTVDYLLSEHSNKAMSDAVTTANRRLRNSRLILMALFASSVWLVAVVLFFVGIVRPKLEWPGGGWLLFCWAVPISLTLCVALNFFWGGDRGWRTSITIMMIWTALTCVYLQLGMTVPDGWTFWAIFLIGVPLTTVAALWDRFSANRAAAEKGE